MNRGAKELSGHVDLGAEKVALGHGKVGEVFQHAEGRAWSSGWGTGLNNRPVPLNISQMERK